MRAYCMIRDQPVYRRNAFVQGLRAVGYEVLDRERPGSKEGDVLVMWNRYGGNHEIATRFEKEGGVVLVAENGYVGNDRSNRTIYALARSGHNGSGEWPVGGPERWGALDIALQPWRTTGEHILVCPNRSFGRPDFIMPVDWAQDVAKRIRRMTDRPVRIRPHPGNDLPKIQLAHDLKDAWAVVIWASSAGCESLIAGVPVFCEAPWWICKSAAVPLLSPKIETPVEPWSDTLRRQAFERLAWAQWNIQEIESGEAFQHLLYDAPTFAGRV